MPPADRKNPKRARSSESRYSLMEFMSDFPDDATCLDWLWRTRFSPDGEHAYCERCGVDRVFTRYTTKQQRQSWTCTGCGLHVHPTAGTIFHKSSTSLHLWFYAMYLMTSTRCGISAKQIERELGVTYKTAWRMFHLIRNELMTPGDETLSGIIEMDETFVGGKLRHSDRGRIAKLPTRPERHAESQRVSAAKKTAVFGMVQRGGHVHATVIPNPPRSEDIRPHVAAHILPMSIVNTDEATHYAPLAKDGKFNHATINHNARVYVSGDVHTQTIEGFWSLVKRGISGTHHAVSAKYLQGYLNEYVWRYNTRDPEGPAQFALLLLRAAFPSG